MREEIPLVNIGAQSSMFQNEQLAAKRKQSKWARLPAQAWRRTLSLGAMATAIVLLLNVVFLIWLGVTRTSPGGVLGFATIYQGPSSFCHVITSDKF